MIEPFFFDSDRLAGLLAEHAPAYLEKKPFAHAIIDNFLPPDVLDKVIQEFYLPSRWTCYDPPTPTDSKLWCDDETQMGPNTRSLISQFNSSRVFLSFLEKLTGIEGLVGDPGLRGGGLHLIKRGGFLKLHVDFNWHEKLKMHRRLNLLLYLNRNWEEDYGGHLELCGLGAGAATVRLLPIFNRFVIFSTTDFSYHGHPAPLNCPADRSRQSIAMYYYTSTRPDAEISAPHSTLFRPGI